MQKNARAHSVKSSFRARQLRSEMSISEQVLWEQLRKKKLGFRFTRQVRVHPYYLDFYCAEASLCVELDGEQHASRREQDQTRDEYLARMGIQTLRIPTLDLFEVNTPAFTRWVEMIRSVCELRSRRPFDSHPQPPPSVSDKSSG